MRRSFVSRQREISCRFSRRSSRRVMSGSRVIIRFAISPHGNPAGSAPRRIRSTLYWVGDRSSDFRIWAGPRESRSQVRSRPRNAASSGVPRAFFVSFIIVVAYIYVITKFVKTHTRAQAEGARFRARALELGQRKRSSPIRGTRFSGVASRLDKSLNAGEVQSGCKQRAASNRPLSFGSSLVALIIERRVYFCGLSRAPSP